MSSLLQKHAQMIVHQGTPLNAGCPLELVRREFITPQECFFVRNHGPVPEVQLEHYRLSVSGMVQHPLELSLDDIRSFPRYTVMATLQCAGIRRNEMAAVCPIPEELLWGAEPISNAEWCGVSLRDVLAAASVTPEAKHVAFTGLDDVERLGKHFGFGGSIPLEKALLPDVLLAYEMNGEPLVPVHGSPLRVVVPGYIGARSVKWLSNINLQDHCSTNYFQAHAYKLFPPQVNAQNVNWDNGQMLSENILNAVICSPKEGEIRAGGLVQVHGYALTGCGSLIERVELSVDDGATWVVANLARQENPWTWCFWECTLPLDAGRYQIIVRAWDASGQPQPEDASSIWNFKGYMNNAWHKVNCLLLD